MNQDLLNNNEFIFNKYMNLKGLRYPKIFILDKIFLFGSHKYKNYNNKVKYLINKYELDKQLNVILDSKFILDLSMIIDKYFEDINISSWLRNIYSIEKNIYLNIEIKFNLGNKFIHNNYLIETTDFIDFKILKKYNLDEYFIFFDLNNKILCSKIKERDNFFWGEYLFNFKINNKNIIPTFDKVVNYKQDRGHLIHNILFDSNLNKYIFIFSIRHKIEKYTNYSNNNDYIYRLYKSETKDFENFYNTEEIKTNHKDLNIEFLSYPSYFKYNNEQYLICNQNEFGKSKNLVLFKNK